MQEVREPLRKNRPQIRQGHRKWKMMNQDYLLHKTICLNTQRAEWRRVINSKWDKATGINGISLKIGCRPTMSDLPKATRVCLFKCTLSLYLPHPCLPHIRITHPLSSSHTCVLVFLFALCLSLSPSRTPRARSPPVKSYLVTARNMLCEPTYLFAFTYRSGAVPRTTEESPSTVETIENTPSRASLAADFEILADAASRRLACL